MLRSALHSRADLPADANQDEDEDTQGASRHGIYRISQGSAVQRGLWGLVVVGVCIGFVLHLIMLVQLYSSYPVSTEMELKTDFFEFPDVTICSTNYMSNTYGNDPVPSPVALAGHSRGISDMIYDVSRFLYLLNQTDMNASVPTNPYTSYRHGKLALNKIAFRVKQFPLPYEILLLCKFNSQPCSYKNFTVYKDDDMFLCMTFTPQNNTVVNAGPGNGLYLVMSTRSTSYWTDEEEINDIPGMKVVLHPRDVRPNMNGPYVMAPLMYKTEAVIESSVQEKLDRVSYSCVDSLPNVTYISDYSQLTGPENVTFQGTTEDCRVRTKQLEFLNECGCLATHLPKPVDLYYQARPGVCHDINEHVLFRDVSTSSPTPNYTYYTIRNDSWSIYPLKDYVKNYFWMYNDTIPRISCYQRVLERQNSYGVDTSDCPVLCLNKYHEVTPRYYRWPNSATYSGMAVKNLGTKAIKEATAGGLDLRSLNDLMASTNTYVNNYISVLDLFPKDLSMRMSTESWAYPLRNFFSDLGGILGLWIGASIVTVIELLEVVMLGVMMLQKRMAKRKQNNIIDITVAEKPSQEQHHEDEFVVAEKL